MDRNAGLQSNRGWHALPIGYYEGFLPFCQIQTMWCPARLSQTCNCGTIIGRRDLAKGRISSTSSQCAKPVDADVETKAKQEED